MKTIIVERSNAHIKTNRAGFHSPDKYMAVVVLPDELKDKAISLFPLRRDRLTAQGIEIIDVGEFYGRSRGPKSMYAACVKKAAEIVKEYE